MIKEVETTIKEDSSIVVLPKLYLFMFINLHILLKWVRYPIIAPICFILNLLFNY